jgi:hypothetical protein
MTPRNTRRFSKAISSRKPAETDVPIIPPTRSKPGNHACTRVAVSAITTDSRTTMVECPSEK